VVVNGVAKTYAMTGWRVGWMIGPPDVMEAAVNYQSQTTSNISNISQRAAVEALTGDLSCVYEMREAFDRRRRTMVRMLNEIDGVSCPEPEGAFYCYPNVEGLLGREIGGRVCTSSAELAETLLDTINIAVVPGEAFGTPGFFRMSYALGDEGIVEGLDRFKNLVARAEDSRTPLICLGLTKGEAVSRVLVTEEIAESGLQELRHAGHEVDVRLGLTPGRADRGDRRRPRADHPFGHPGGPRPWRPRRTSSWSGAPASGWTTWTSTRRPNWA
jgi:hypothetical protein